MTEEDVWRDYILCYEKNKCNSFDRIVMNLESFHFPYPNVDKLTFYEKSNILLGMVSGYNYDDIVWFSIKKLVGFTLESKKIKEEFEKYLTPEMIFDIQWVMSEKTFDKLKKELKLKEKIKEELLGYINNSNKWNNPAIGHMKYDVYQQPKSIKRMENNIRGIIRNDGELFVVNDSKNIIHENLRMFLHNKGLIEYYNNVFIMRDGSTNNFYLSESYFDMESLESIFDYEYDAETSYQKILEVLRRCKEKNPQYNFIPRNIHYKDVDLLEIVKEFTL